MTREVPSPYANITTPYRGVSAFDYSTLISLVGSLFRLIVFPAVLLLFVGLAGALQIAALALSDRFGIFPLYGFFIFNLLAVGCLVAVAFRPWLPVFRFRPMFEVLQRLGAQTSNFTVGRTRVRPDESGRNDRPAVVMLIIRRKQIDEPRSRSVGV